MEPTLTAEEFLLLHLTDDKRYSEICKEYEIDKGQLSEWWENQKELRYEIKRSNALFSNKKGKPEFAAFARAGKRAFFTWYRKQKRKCHYCETEEKTLTELFEAGVLATKRFRGRSLELERRDAKGNQYSEENCVLACYFCNNHKSDIISEEDHRLYFAPQIRKFLDYKYAELQKQKALAKP